MTENLITLPARTLLTVDGRGAPTDAAFGAAIGTLFAARAALGAPGDVPVEGTYSQDDDRMRFDLDRPDTWVWTLAVPAPDGATAERAAEAGVVLRERPSEEVAQVEYVGAYADEGPTLAALYSWVEAGGLTPTGPHTEVYLTDPATTAPGDNRTLLRVPVNS